METLSLKKFQVNQKDIVVSMDIVDSLSAIVDERNTTEAFFILC